MRLVAIDPGTVCGWARCNNAQMESGVEQLGKYGKGHGKRLLRFHTLLRFLCSPAPDVLYVEEPLRPVSMKAALGQKLFGLSELYAETEGIKFMGIMATHVKRWATENGRASKEDMMVEAAKVLGREPETHDEADAVLLLCYAKQREGVR